MTVPSTQLHSNDRVALALGSSFIGYYVHSGLVSEIEEQGIELAAISGASAGALIAGAYAAGIRGAQLIDLALCPSLKRSFLDFGAIYRLPVMCVNLGSTGLFSCRGAVDFLNQTLQGATIESCHTPTLQIAVTNMTEQKGELLTRGNLAQAIVASCSMPPLFSMQGINGAQYWDGGITNELPFEHWLDDPTVDAIVTHRILSPHDSPGRRHTALSGTWASHLVINQELLAHRKRLAKEKGKKLIELTTRAPRPSLITSEASKHEFVESGRATARLLQRTPNHN